MIRPEFTTDAHLAKVHKPGVYNCFDFVRDVWLDATGEDVAARLQILRTPITERKATKADRAAFKRLDKPEGVCLVFMHNPRQTPHVGIFLRGRVLHLTEQFGVMFQRVHMATMGYRRVGFYA